MILKYCLSFSTGLTISLPTGNLYSENGGSVFVIDRIKEADTDTYSCVATNLLGSVTATAHITVTPEGESVELNLR